MLSLRTEHCMKCVHDSPFPCPAHVGWFQCCPMDVKRNVWRTQEPLFRERVLPLFSAYATVGELASPIQEMNYDESAPVRPRARYVQVFLLFFLYICFIFLAYLLLLLLFLLSDLRVSGGRSQSPYKLFSPSWGTAFLSTIACYTCAVSCMQPRATHSFAIYAWTC